MEGQNKKYSIALPMDSSELNEFKNLMENIETKVISDLKSRDSKIEPSRLTVPCKNIKSLQNIGLYQQCETMSSITYTNEDLINMGYGMTKRIISNPKVEIIQDSVSEAFILENSPGPRITYETHSIKDKKYHSGDIAASRYAERGKINLKIGKTPNEKFYRSNQQPELSNSDLINTLIAVGVPYDVSIGVIRKWNLEKK